MTRTFYFRRQAFQPSISENTAISAQPQIALEAEAKTRYKEIAKGRKDEIVNRRILFFSFNEIALEAEAKTRYKEIAKGRKDESQMTLLVGLVSQKGGVGKSTLARLIAREYAAAGWDVKIADLDISQGTNVDWKQRREINGIQPEIAVEPFRTVAQALKHANVHDLVALDGAPHSMQGTLEIARASDLIVLPTGLSLDDLKPSVLLAHELVKAKIPSDKIVFTLCRVGDRENEIAEARSYIHKAGYPTVTGSIPEKTAYRQASDSGRAVSEVTFPTLKQRAEEVAQGIIDKLSKTEE